eukprot:scaffold9000_cov100-Skeletonema_marinoi.AAC.1
MDDLLSSTESGDNAHATDGGDEFFDTYFDSSDDEGDYQGVCRAVDDVVDCPGKDEAFVTTCSGTDNIDSPADNAEEASHDEPTIIDSVDFDEDDLVNEVLEDFDNSQNENNFKQEEAEEDGVCDAAYDNTPMQQLRANINTLTKRYYDPLPRNGKVAIGTGL